MPEELRLGPYECRGGVVREVDSIALRELIDSELEIGREFFSVSALYLTVPPFAPANSPLFSGVHSSAG